MAAWAQSPGTNCASRNDENGVEIQFIDEDELPLACISVLEHPESEEEIGSDNLAESSGDESEESESEEDEDVEEEEQWAWREEMNRRNDVDFNEFVEVCISNAHILERKSPNHSTRTALDFRKSLISDLIEGNSFRRDTRMQPPPAPEIRFNQEHFYHLVRSDKRSTCQVHIQRVLDTFYSCAV
ncbi:uncharacterized protein LOC114950998 isoform X3 [Acropora millepora]|uniref:uncharacterized protein LOC114950998 isoform X3 n=1 Tax=Acropora millepora TaxID=45264 RepID=UPI001CF25583|nr:uncharacterized protein LOC114950998 isoform X3 [Acropora millepora]